MSPELLALAREAVRAVAIIVGASILMLGALAISHDGEIANAIAAQLEGAISWGLPVIGGIVVVLQVATAYVSGKNSSPGTGTPPPPAQGTGQRRKEWER